MSFGWARLLGHPTDVSVRWARWRNLARLVLTRRGRLRQLGHACRRDQATTPTRCNALVPDRLDPTADERNETCAHPGVRADISGGEPRHQLARDHHTGAFHGGRADETEQRMRGGRVAA